MITTTTTKNNNHNDATTRRQVMATKPDVSLFTEVDRYLKTEKYKFKDLFNRYDRDESGVLSSYELRLLVRDLLPRVTEGQLNYLQVMLDVDGDGSVTQEEFLSVARTALAAESVASREALDPQVKATLDQVSSFLSKYTTNAEVAFKTVDSNGRGSLAYPDLGRALKRMIPGLSQDQIRHVVAYLFSQDVYQQGAVTFKELMRLLKATPLRMMTASGTQVMQVLSTGFNTYQTAPAPTTTSYSSGGVTRPLSSPASSVQSMPQSSAGGGSASWDPTRRTSTDRLSISSGPLKLEPLSYGGESYLLDPRTNVVYTVPHPGGWPQPVGRWDPVAGSLRTRKKDTATSLFRNLDNYLRGYQVKFKEMFNAFDADRNGWLDGVELATLVKKLLPAVTDGDVKYLRVMIDADGDGRITYDEFLSAAKACMEDEQKAVQRVDATVRQVLHQVSDYLRRHRETVQALFDRYDLDHNRALEPVEVARLLRETIPGISATHMRYVMTHLHEVDLNGDGLITLQELMVALRAVDVQTPQGLQTGGFLERTGSLQQQQQLGGQAAAGMGQRPGTPGSMSSASSYPAGHRTPTAAGGYGSGYGGDAPVSPTGSSFSGGEWLLEDFEAHGQRLLRDPATNYVYTPAAPDNGGWPELYGKMDPTTGQLVARPRAAIADLFSRLDSHLQTYRVKFQQLFNEFDADRNGYLDAREFNTFIRRLMPETRPADVAYYASMIDANGDGAITAQEFLSAAADCMHAAQAITDYAQNPEVVAALDTACQRVLANPQRIRQLFNEVDMNRSGSLEPVELAAFFRRVVPELQAQHMRYLMAYVRYMDLDQDGRISWQEVLRSLHVVAPKLRSTGAPIAQTGFRTVDAAAAAAGGYGPSVALSPRRSSGTITASPLNLDWQLESVAAGRKRYLVDRSVIPPALYDDVASAAEWPALAGRLVGGSMQFVDSSAYAKLFASLDAYLKTNRVKFSQLFDSFVAKGRPAAGYGRRAPPPPAPGQGTLDMDQLYALVSHIMPGTTPAQLKFFHAMMDANGDGVISQKEFLDAAGECLKQSADQAADVAAQPVLQQVSDALYRDPSNTQRVFDSVDKARTGALEYPGLVIFFRYISGGKSVAEVRQLLSHMARCDVSGKGAFSLMDVLKAMRAVNLRTVVHGPHARGFLPPGGMMSSHHGGDGGYQQHQQQQALSRWVLTDFRAAGQPPLLLDEESRVLYSRPATLADWPQAVGRLDGRNRPVLLQDATASARAFFSALDEYLKTNRMRLRDLFVKYDANRSGTLDMGELSRLVQTLLPQAGRGTLSYFSAMAAGYGGDNMQLSYDEFLDLIKECVKLEEAAMHGALSPDMLAALAGVSDFLIGNRASAQRLFEAADSNRDGRLQYGELAALFRRLMPNITTQQLRTIMAQAHTIDVDGDGTISFNELLQALRAVELHTSLGVHATGFGSATVTGSGKQHALQEMKGFGSMIRDSAPGAASDLPAVIDSLQLETVTSRAKTYCVDRATGTAYNNVEKEEWPQALGKYNSRSRSVELRSTPTTSALFAALDEALRIQKQRLKQLFDRYDRDGSGGLDPSELGTLLRDLLGRTKVSDADSAYFQSMLDENRDRAITLAELMSLAKASLTQQRAAQDVRAEPMAQLMREVQGRLRADPENALQLWMRCDTSRARNGLLTYPQLRSFFTSLVPDLAIAEERSLLTRMHDCDHSGTGAFHFNDVLIAFRAIAITTPAMRRDAFYERAGGAQQQQDANRGLGRSNTLRAAQTPRGRDADAAFEANFGNDGRRRGGPTLDVAPRDRNRSDPSPPDMRTVWTLKAMKVDGERVLVDPNTRCVYEYTENASRGWPRLIGKLAPDDDGALLPLPGATGGGGTSDLFGALDEFLKKNRRRLREVFDQVDADGSGCLSAAELADLVVALLPDATEAQLRYFQVMLDYDGDGRITYEEFVQAIRDCRSAGAAARGKDSVELADVMAKAAAAVAGDRQRAWDVFQRFDADEDGVLDSRELARFFKAVLPGLTAAEVRMLLAHAYELDVNGDGYLDFNELLLALRAVSIQLPGAGKQVVQGTWGGKGGAGASKAAANAAEDADSARIDAALASYQEVREWRLEELELPNEDSQGHVFLDPSTNLVYRFHEDAEWLQLYGRLLPGGRVKPVTDSAGGASAQLYAALDQHLKERGVRLSQVRRGASSSWRNLTIEPCTLPTIYSVLLRCLFFTPPNARTRARIRSQTFTYVLLLVSLSLA